jgi:hypothetical protein
MLFDIPWLYNISACSYTLVNCKAFLSNTADDVFSLPYYYEQQSSGRLQFHKYQLGKEKKIKRGKNETTRKQKYSLTK